MNNYHTIFSTLRDNVEKALSTSDGCHDFDHTLRVLANARMIAKQIPEADMMIVELSALLHDIARPEEQRSRGKICHAAAGAEIAGTMLKEAGFSERVISAVSSAVRTHRYRNNTVPETIEAKIVYDADKLDSLGAVGLGRSFLFAGHIGARLHNTAEEALASEAYSREDTVYREYLVKLRKLPSAMLTPPGKSEGARRLRFMKRFFDRLEAEIRAATE